MLMLLKYLDFNISDNFAFRIYKSIFTLIYKLIYFDY
jgi:hypothetical protein